MKEQPISKLEAHIERIVESVFVRFAGRRITAHDIIVRLAHVIEANLQPAIEPQYTRIAPDDFTIFLSSSTYSQLISGNGKLEQYLAEYVAKVITARGYQTKRAVTLKLAVSYELRDHDLNIVGYHSQESDHSTAVMQPISMPVVQGGIIAQLVIASQNDVQISKSLITIGRGSQNDVVIEDRHVSRQHIQLRQRGGIFYLFDLGSRSGTYVNEIRVTEHRLRSGDVIAIGNTQMIFIQNDFEVDETPTTRLDSIS